MFVLDGGVNRLFEVSPTNGAVVKDTDLSANGDGGILDAMVADGFLYALSIGPVEPSVVVVDVVARKMVQHVGLKALGASNYVQGLAVFV